MFWDRVAFLYDIFAYGINRKANKLMCSAVESWIEPSDTVLECACGTGLLSYVIADKCARLTATDFSANMLKRAERKCRKLSNIELRKGNILSIEYPDESFDAVVAANVIHLLEDPYKALSELIRVCRKGGRIIIPTYINRTEKGRTNSITGAIGKAGAGFKREFSFESYKEFFDKAGYRNAEFRLCYGRVSCAVAMIRRESD